MDTSVYQNQTLLLKSLLWVGIVSIVMFFAGLTSAVVVSKVSGNWISYQIPSVFLISTLTIVISSFTYEIGLRFSKNAQWKSALTFFGITFLLGVVFITAQFLGWKSLIAEGIFATGVNSNVSGSYFYLIVLLHLLHFAVAMFSLSIVTYKTFNHKYTHSGKIEVSVIFWHFLTVLWVYVFFFLQYMIHQ